MDVMELRRGLLMGMMGGSAMVGKFSKYEQKNVVFSTADNSTALLSFDVSFQPKMIVFTGGSDVNGNVKQGFALFDYDVTNKLWGIIYGRYTNGNNVGACMTPVISSSAPTAGNQKLEYYDGKIYLTRINTLMYWSNTDTYTFEIYG